MKTYVVLLRGINVGGRIVRMADLKDCFQKLGFSNVRTLLQSGNVIFETDASSNSLKPRIEKALTQTFNYPAKVQVFSQIELRKIIEACPYASDDANLHAYVVFVENNLAGQLADETIDLGAGEEIRLGNGVVYWRCTRGNTLTSSFGKLLTKSKYQAFNTTRNLRTLRKISNFEK
jgi:uncharacterized protein (DUF1697 family)